MTTKAYSIIRGGGSAGDQPYQLIHTPDTAYFEDDFLGGGIDDGTIGTTGFGLCKGPGSRGSVNYVTIQGQPGELRLVTGNQSGDYTAIYHRAAFVPNMLSAIESVFLVRLLGSGASLANTDFRIGFTDSSANPITISGGISEPPQGVYFEKMAADTNVFAVSGSYGGSQNRVDTGVAAPTDFSQHLFKIRRTGTDTYGFIIDANTEDTVTDAYDNKNASWMPFIQVKTNTAAVRYAAADYAWYKGTVSDRTV